MIKTDVPKPILGWDFTRKHRLTSDWTEYGDAVIIDKRNALILETICNLVGIKAQQKLKGTLSRIALLGSYRIFLARRSPEWSGGELISVS